MAMSDCERCWETPCSCGHEFFHQVKRMDLHALILMKMLIEKRISEIEHNKADELAESI